MIERREVHRGRVFYGGVIELNNGLSTADCTIRNLSPRGAKVEVAFGTTLSNKVGLTIWHRGKMFPATTVWNRGNEAGLVFDLHGDTHNVIDLAKNRKLRGGVLRGFVADRTAGSSEAYVLLVCMGGLMAAAASYGVNVSVGAKLEAIAAVLKKH